MHTILSKILNIDTQPSDKSENYKVLQRNRLSSPTMIHQKIVKTYANITLIVNFTYVLLVPDTYSPLWTNTREHVARQNGNYLFQLRRLADICNWGMWRHRDETISDMLISLLSLFLSAPFQNDNETIQCENFKCVFGNGKKRSNNFFNCLK